MRELEEGTSLQLDYRKLTDIGSKRLSVVPAAVQNADTKEVLLIAYVNEAALRASMQTRVATFWSTSRNELWVKGATSGDTYELLRILVNCEQNSLLFIVRPQRGGICHTKNSRGVARNCFYRELDLGTMQLKNLDP